MGKFEQTSWLFQQPQHNHSWIIQILSFHNYVMTFATLIALLLSRQAEKNNKPLSFKVIINGKSAFNEIALSIQRLKSPFFHRNWKPFAINAWKESGKTFLSCANKHLPIINNWFGIILHPHITFWLKWNGRDENDWITNIMAS